ncbi:MAG TPA: family 10 glycosylhydrolase [Chthonomonadaceae bacterium]|nr:family 10 glycosylhydrolase [Chthonomonadaceae bacterium]
MPLPTLFRLVGTCLCMALLCALFALPLDADSADKAKELPPAPPREFRGVWVATVANIDWPSKPGLPVEDQKAELLAILDRAAQMRLNAIIFQVRPACDALYDSKLEPWSEYLTGQQGQAPAPYYDPLAFAVEEAHRRGLELHAWFNPYRARHAEAKSTPSADHISQTHPEIVRQYGGYLWLDPGEKAVQDHSLAVILDVVKRYDIDGVHIDDYFYPYKETDANRKILPFPDDASWQRYVASGGKLDRDDWRRENVNVFIERLYKGIKQEKPWVKFGISPFGIWRPGHPDQIKGFDAYEEIYADSRKWLVNGWCDYWTPQLYWPIHQTAQSYPALLKWWVEQNKKGRHIWPGNYTSRVTDGGKSSWTPEEVVHQVDATREQKGASGNVHFSMQCLMQNRCNLADTLATGVYAHPALVPASPWLKGHAPGRPKVELDKDATSETPTLSWQPGGGEPVWQWVVQTYANGAWTTDILPGNIRTFVMAPDSPQAQATRIAVSGVDRCGNQGPSTLVDVPHP